MAKELDVERVRRKNEAYARSLRWDQYSNEICDLVGQPRGSTSTEAFVAAVATWQKSQGLEPDGIIGPASWKEIQHDLGLLGPRAGRLNTYYANALGWRRSKRTIAAIVHATDDDPTSRAMIRAIAKWQREQGLDHDGVVGPKTWKKLKPLVEAREADGLPIPLRRGAPDPEPTPDAAPGPTPERVSPPTALPPPKRRPAVPTPAELARDARPIPEDPNTKSPVDDAFLAEAASWNDGPIRISGYGELGRGDVVLDVEGHRRLILAYEAPFVVFITEDNLGWVQRYEGFDLDVRFAPIALGGQQSLPAKRLLEVEMQLLLGMLAGSSIVGFALVNGVALIDFVIIHARDFGRWADEAQRLKDARDELKRTAPALYDALVETALGELWQRMPESITADRVAYFTGQLVALLWTRSFAGVADVAKGIGITLARTILPTIGTAVDAGHAVAKDLESASAEVIAAFRAQGVELTEDDARRIVEEYRAHPDKIAEALDAMGRALEGLQR
ncbi:peptidoglycan-binding protein [Myxococcota bacterium]|nr:peptidoglycan-binding protein [Myxococcota bacterium]